MSGIAFKFRTDINLNQAKIIELKKRILMQSQASLIKPKPMKSKPMKPKAMKSKAMKSKAMKPKAIIMQDEVEDINPVEAVEDINSVEPVEAVEHINLVDQKNEIFSLEMHKFLLNLIK